MIGWDMRRERGTCPACRNQNSTSIGLSTRCVSREVHSCGELIATRRHWEETWQRSIGASRGEGWTKFPKSKRISAGVYDGRQSMKISPSVSYASFEMWEKCDMSVATRLLGARHHSTAAVSRIILFNCRIHYKAKMPPAKPAFLRAYCVT